MLETSIKKYSFSLMSDSKWRRLFSVVHDGSIPLSVCYWKLVESKEVKEGSVPNLELLGDSFVGDCGALNGPFSFREIEWILLPARFGYRPYEKAPLRYSYQDVSIIAAMIDAQGKFEYEMSDEGLKIYGYKLSELRNHQPEDPSDAA